MNWHSKTKENILRDFKTSKKGLSEVEAKKRLRLYGKNIIKKAHNLRTLKILFQQINSFLIYILILASIISFFIGHLIDGIVIMAIVFLNSGLGFFQQYKAEKAVSKLKSLLVPITRVIRDSRMAEISSFNLVPGDLIFLDAGDRVNADCRIIESENLEVDEAILTGESFSVEKSEKVLSEKTPLAERENMLFAGTRIVKGNSKAIVVSTGMSTEFGKIAYKLQRIGIQKTPMQKILDKFSKKLGLIIIGLVFVIFLLSLLKESDLFVTFMISIALVIGAIPEGLPAVLAIAFSIASRSMFRKNVIIRRLPAVESLGSVTVICSDKTGTITREKMDVQKIFSNNKLYTRKNKDIFLSNKKINLSEIKSLLMLFKTSVLCNNARFERDNRGYSIIGEPTEEALLSAALEFNMDKKRMIEKEPSLKKFEFDSKRKMMSILRKNRDIRTLYSKGAPEKIISLSESELINGKIKKMTKKRKSELIKESRKLEGQAYRVLGFAYRDFKNKERVKETDLVFLGFSGMIDPPRKEVKKAIEECKSSGINIKMITGDSILTARAIAEQIGLKGKSITGEELESLDTQEFSNSVKEGVIFARTTPSQKLRIIEELQENREVVAVTGDGINDVLALKSADIGIAMGKRGTDVARDVSDIILSDDNFASIVEGVKQGRKTYDNIKKFIKYILSVNFDTILLITIITSFGLPLPMLPLQILWKNLVTDSFPGITLIFEKEEEVMKTKPRREKSILSGIWKFIILGGLANFLACASVYFLTLNSLPIEHVRTMVLTTGVLFELIFVYTCRSDKSLLKIGLFSNKYLNYSMLIAISLHLIMLYTPLSIAFNFTALGIKDWLFILPFALSGIIIFETAKIIRKKF